MFPIARADRAVRFTAIALALAGPVAWPFAHADDGVAARIPPSPLYRQECASCHIAYPPSMLPAASWLHLMRNLPHHFGADASLEPAAVKELSDWLAANAGDARRVRDRPAQDRITRTAWFVREHREIGASAWQRPSIRSASNCAACHTRAEQGVFDEHDVRIPR
jgi:hypothetical protein